MKSPSQPIAVRETEVRKSGSVAILGRDYPGTAFEVLVKPGEPVLAGAALMRDRRRPEICFAAPAAGTVRTAQRGPRRSVASLRVDVDPEGESMVHDVPGDLSAARLRTLLQQSGLWTAIRQRPFGTIPDPDAEPHALLITACDSRPFAPDPAEVIGMDPMGFKRGSEALALITDAPVYLCQASGASLPVTGNDRIRVVEFPGDHPAGLPGRHIQRLCPVGNGARVAWHIDYQDVMAVGQLLATGIAIRPRLITVYEPAGGNGLVQVLPGSRIRDLLTDGLNPERDEVVSGSPIDGVGTETHDAYLGRYHNQVSVRPKAGGASGEASGTAVPAAMIPTTDLDRVAPPGILVVPLMRTLQMGDHERAQALGALELIEEDMALLSRLCTSRTDYGGLLRTTLDWLRREQGAIQ